MVRASLAGTAPTKLFLTLGRNRSLFRRWLVMLAARYGTIATLRIQTEER